MSLFDACERCGCDLPMLYSVATLYGGYKARFCSRCLTAWHKRLTSDEVWTHRVNIDAHERWMDALAVAGKPSTEEHYLDHEEDRRRNESRAFEIAVDFAKPTTKPER